MTLATGSNLRVLPPSVEGHLVRGYSSGVAELRITPSLSLVRISSPGMTSLTERMILPRASRVIEKPRSKADSGQNGGFTRSVL